MDYEGLAMRQYTCKPGKIQFSIRFDLIILVLTLFMHTAMEIVIEMIKGFLFHYPNQLRRAFIINGNWLNTSKFNSLIKTKTCGILFLFIEAPKYFPYLFAMVKPFIPQTDIPKIKIFGCDTKQWTSALLEEIDAHQLPAFYGGTLTDPQWRSQMS